jgi:hypothetical protein
MNPAIAEVGLVDESFEAAQLQIAELHTSGIDAHHAAAIAVDPRPLPSDAPPPQWALATRLRLPAVAYRSKFTQQ